MTIAGDVDVDINADRAVEIDKELSINLSIFDSLRIFTASEFSLKRDEDNEIDSAQALFSLLSKTQVMF